MKIDIESEILKYERVVTVRYCDTDIVWITEYREKFDGIEH